MAQGLLVHCWALSQGLGFCLWWRWGSFSHPADNKGIIVGKQPRPRPLSTHCLCGVAAAWGWESRSCGMTRLEETSHRAGCKDQRWPRGFRGHGQNSWLFCFLCSISIVQIPAGGGWKGYGKGTATSGSKTEEETLSLGMLCSPQGGFPGPRRKVVGPHCQLARIKAAVAHTGH